MNDNQQLQNQGQGQNQSQATVPFGGSLPFTNIPAKKDDLANVVYGPSNPEGQPIKVENPAEAAKLQENTGEIQKLQENKPEKIHEAELKEFKPVYPQNQQQTQTAFQPIPVNPVKPAQPAPKFFGYMVSPQISNNYKTISALKGQGDPQKSRTWIYMLLDRILKKQTYTKNQKI